jgi:hypothetical protein
MRKTHMATYLYKKTEELSDLSEGRHEPVGGRHHPQVLAQSEVGECASEARKKKIQEIFFSNQISIHFSGYQPLCSAHP